MKTRPYQQEHPRASWALAALLVTVGACVPPPVQLSPGEVADLKSSIPECAGEADCKAKWEAAQLWVIHNCPFKIQTANDVLIETFGPGREIVTTTFAMRVTKEPLGQGRYMIVGLAISANPYFNASGVVLAFDRAVAAAGELPPQAPAAEPRMSAAPVSVSIEQAWNECLTWVRAQFLRTSRVGFPAYDGTYLQASDGRRFAFAATAIEQPAKGVPVKRSWSCAVTYDSEGHATAHELDFKSLGGDAPKR